MASDEQHQQLGTTVYDTQYYEVGKLLAADLWYNLHFVVTLSYGTKATIKEVGDRFSSVPIKALLDAYEKNPDEIRNMAKSHVRMTQFAKDARADPGGSSLGTFPVASPAEHQKLYDAIVNRRYFDVGKSLSKDVVFNLEFVEISGYTIHHAASVLSTPEIGALIKAYKRDPNGTRVMSKTREGLISFFRSKFGSGQPEPK